MTTMTTSGLPEELQAAFIRGYDYAAPEGYDAFRDCQESPQPWCCPWYAMARDAWQQELHAALLQTGGDMEQAGGIFARQDFEALTAIIAEARQV